MQRQESKSLPEVLQRASLRLASSVARVPAHPPAARHYRRWTEQGEAALRALAPRASLEQIARRLQQHGVPPARCDRGARGYGGAALCLDRDGLKAMCGGIYRAAEAEHRRLFPSA